MSQRKQLAISILRRLRLLALAEWLRYQVARLRSDRARFLREHPGVILPPSESYDAFGSLNWTGYWNGGIVAADLIAAIIQEHAAARHGALLEWGCGAARIIRHLPERLPGWRLCGSDYNARIIEWCAASIPSVTFTSNGDFPPLPYADGTFDCIYNISVFTHLSAEQHARWIAELRRLLKPGGLLVTTLHGEACKPYLLPDEVRRFERGELVVRDGVKQGSRCYLAYHPERFVTGELFRGMEIIKRWPGLANPLGYQDIWIARVPQDGVSAPGAP